MQDSDKQHILEVKNYDYATKYEYTTKSVAAINKNGCLAVCIKCDLWNALSAITKQIELKVIYDSNTECAKIKNVNVASYSVSAIALSESHVVLLFETEVKYDDYGNKTSLTQKQIMQLYDLKKLDSSKLQIESGSLYNTIHSFMNEENIYFITESQPFIHIFNLKLEHLGSVGSPNYANQYHIESNKININNGYIFCQEERKIRIFNEITGIFIREFELDEDIFEIVGITKLSEICVFYSTKHLIKKYNFNGKLETEYGPIEEDTESIQMTENGIILINDKKNLKLKILEIN